MTGYWTVDGDLSYEQFGAIRESLRDVEPGTPKVVIDGITLHWHELDIVTEQEAVTRALRSIREQVEVMIPLPSDRTFYEEGWVDARRRALAILDQAAPDET